MHHSYLVVVVKHVDVAVLYAHIFWIDDEIKLHQISVLVVIALHSSPAVISALFTVFVFCNYVFPCLDTYLAPCRLCCLVTLLLATEVGESPYRNTSHRPNMSIETLSCSVCMWFVSCCSY